MSLTYPRLMWGWAVTTSTNKLDFVDNGTTYAATLRLGNYEPAEFAAEVQRAMRDANTNNDNNTCTFSYSTQKFTLTGTSTFSLLFDSGANRASSCGNLLGFTIGDGVGTGDDETGATTYTSEAVVGTSPSTAKLWDPADPVANTTPVSAAADGTTATLLQRDAKVIQNRADGGKRETIYFSTDKMLRLHFRWITSGTEQTNMEAFLDWILQGRRFSYQPDKTSTNALRLLLVEPYNMANVFSWQTRDEIDWPEMTFVEALSRT